MFIQSFLEKHVFFSFGPDCHQLLGSNQPLRSKLPKLSIYLYFSFVWKKRGGFYSSSQQFIHIVSFGIKYLNIGSMRLQGCSTEGLLIHTWEMSFGH